MKIEINDKMYELAESDSDTLQTCDQCAFNGDVDDDCTMPSNDNDIACLQTRNDNKFWKEVNK